MSHVFKNYTVTVEDEVIPLRVVTALSEADPVDCTDCDFINTFACHHTDRKTQDTDHCNLPRKSTLKAVDVLHSRVLHGLREPVEVMYDAG